MSPSEATTVKITNKTSRSLIIAESDQTVEPGEDVDVSAELGMRLLEQPDVWGESKPKSSKAGPSGDSKSEEG